MYNPELFAAIPQTGNETCLHFNNGNQSIVDSNSKEYMKGLCLLTGTTMDDSHRLFPRHEGTGIRLGDGRIFAEIKVSCISPIYGYFLLSAIKKVTINGEGHGVIHLTNGEIHSTLWRNTTLIRHLKMVQETLGK